MKSRQWTVTVTLGRPWIKGQAQRGILVGTALGVPRRNAALF